MELDGGGGVNFLNLPGFVQQKRVKGNDQQFSKTLKDQSSVMSYSL